MMRHTVLGALAAALVFANLSWAAPKQLKIEKEFRGSVEDEKLAKEAPANNVITSKAALEKLWKAWSIKDEMPTLDFSKELVLVAITVGSRLNVNATLSEEGDLRVLALATRDLRPGFRYHIVIVKREGVKTVQGKELPKE